MKVTTIDFKENTICNLTFYIHKALKISFTSVKMPIDSWRCCFSTGTHFYCKGHVSHNNAKLEFFVCILICFFVYFHAACIFDHDDLI